MPSTSPVLRIRGLHKQYDRTPVLAGIDLEIGKGEVICVLGSSGSGKSTLLRCINQLEIFDRGAIEINGTLIGCRLVNGKPRRLSAGEARHQRAQTGMVFQNFNLFPHLTVLENIILGPVKSLGIVRAEARNHARLLLDQFGLAGKEDARPSYLSGGQQQRVAIARALAMKPSLILFDEPTSALDPELVHDVTATLKQLARGGMTMIIVTHELSFACEIADRIVLLDRGTVVEQGPPEQFLTGSGGDRARQFFARHKAKILEER
ncbi:amino acid ABC transporter ATP-binding protein [Sphingomonas sp.]|uniref:amino acid ABC transporter ATP-binding protein n=1 Tax=Sphingomonas sp. TaxID=28214 RepID=UPI00345C44B7